ncbi:hypothetical protein GPECTOR_69g458 [Gonium pectorale]|uniref:Uncharacterized protein n=1 Tax=Gonium pectorale TaxID=33097 RepID=A0A150G4B6_GONPE|nr:hypothetical protein GPECTOR_69g458 [Gonium pectorale]|eukprot:KXZ44365.1 hypothetical protein GPECTOR_69g458 [Gonium pectorale]
MWVLHKRLPGAATSVYAATAPELAAQSGAFLSDCRVTPSSPAGQDPQLAARLWEATEALLARALRGELRREGGEALGTEVKTGAAAGEGEKGDGAAGAAAVAAVAATS